MYNYSRLGLQYNSKKKKAKKTNKVKEKKTDWINILLFILLGIVVILFIIT